MLDLVIYQISYGVRQTYSFGRLKSPYYRSFSKAAPKTPSTMVENPVKEKVKTVKTLFSTLGTAFFFLYDHRKLTVLPDPYVPQRFQSNWGDPSSSLLRLFWFHPVSRTISRDLILVLQQAPAGLVRPARLKSNAGEEQLNWD